MMFPPELETVMRRPGEKEEPLGPVGGTICLLVATGLAILVLRLLLQGAISLWERFPTFASSTWGAITVGAAVALLGAILFMIREKMRFVYASLELGAAIGVSIEACLRIGPTALKSALVFALLGSVYIAVRAYDNFAKVLDERAKKRES